MANQAMERSLSFAGYEVAHNWGDGQHNVDHGTQVFPDAMRWLWKDWPEQVKAGSGSPQLQELLIPGEDWKVVGRGYQSADGLAINPKGQLFFNDVTGNRGFRLSIEGQLRDSTTEGKRGDVQCFGPDGLLYSCASVTGQILVLDTKGKSSVVADGLRVSDMVVLSDGRMYVATTAPNSVDPSKIWYISPKGEKKIVDSGLGLASGLCVSPDQSLLYVIDARSHWGYSYQIQRDGSLSFKQKYFHLHVPDTADDAGAEAIRCDRDGRVWIATRLGLQVCDQAGRVNCIIPTPVDRMTGLGFGGENFDILYCAGRDRVYSRKFKVRGSNGWEAPTLPGKPRL